MLRTRWYVLAAIVVALGGIGVREALSGPYDRLVALGQYPTQIAVDAALGRAYVINAADNTLSILDTRTGAVLRTVQSGPGPATLAVDEGTRRVFALDGGVGSLHPLGARGGGLPRTERIGAYLIAPAAARSPGAEQIRTVGETGMLASSEILLRRVCYRWCQTVRACRWERWTRRGSLGDAPAVEQARHDGDERGWNARNTTKTKTHATQQRRSERRAQW